MATIITRKIRDFGGVGEDREYKGLDYEYLEAQYTTGKVLKVYLGLTRDKFWALAEDDVIIKNHTKESECLSLICKYTLKYD
jgi:hypothetical protein